MTVPPPPEDEQPEEYGFGAPPPDAGGYGQAPYGQAPYGQPAPGPYAQGPYGPPPGYPPFPVYAPVAPTSQKAVWALVCSLLTFMSCCLPLSIVGICLGVSAKRDIVRAPGTLQGEGLAQAGLIVGIVATVLCGAYYALIVTAGILG